MGSDDGGLDNGRLSFKVRRFSGLYMSTNDLVARRCMRGRRGCMKRHSLCPANEYAPMVHVMTPSMVLRASLPRCTKTDRMPWTTKGREVVQRIGMACET